MSLSCLSRRAGGCLILIAFLAILQTPNVARSEEPAWIFNNGSDAANAVVGQGRVSLNFAIFDVVATGTDLTVSVQMRDEQVFKADKRPFFALRYKAETKKNIGGLFFTNDDNLLSLSDKSFTTFPIEGDGEWHNVVVNMRERKPDVWKGSITSFRIDPTNPSEIDSKISISRFGFFKSEYAAYSFLNLANDKPDLTLGATVSNEVCRCLLPAGTVKPDFDKSQYLLDPKATITLSDKTADDRATLVVSSGKEVASLCAVSSRGFVVYCLDKPGNWKLLKRPVKATDVENSSLKDEIKFVLARNLMKTDEGNAFRPQERLSENDVKLVVDALAPFKDSKALGGKIDLFEKKLADALHNGVTREEAAKLVAEGVRTVLDASISSPFSKEYFTRERLRIGAWGNFNPGDFGDEYMKTYADCGFDFLLPFVSAPTNELLTLCDKYGIEATVNDGSYRNPVAGTREYFDHPSFTGCYVVDEPGSDAYDALAKDCNNYAKETGKRPYVNLLPMYANAAQLKYGAGAAAIEYYDPDPDLFRKYCAAFCEKFDTDYICTDIYPLNWSDGKKTTYASYAESINIIASVAREYKRDFWCYIQTFGWIKSKRTPNEAEFRWQCYSMLSFGCQTILCWTYAGYHPGFPSLVDVNSAKTGAWYDARSVFQELRRLSDVYVQYRNVGAFSHNCTEKTPYLKFSNEYKNFNAIREIDCPDPLLIGCFENKNDPENKAFTLVNMTELQDAVGTTVRLKLNAQGAVAWYRGVPAEVKPNDEGWYEFYLGTGEGTFVTLK